MVEVRQRFHDELGAIEQEVLAEGELVERAIARAVEALVTGDQTLATQVIAEDDAVDEHYLSVERRILGVLALQTPVAGDLRRVVAILLTATRPVFSSMDTASVKVPPTSTPT